MPNMPDIMPLFSRRYNHREEQHFRHQLNVWCDRVGLHHIEFRVIDERVIDGQRWFQVVPLFPQIYRAPSPLPQYAGCGPSKIAAQCASQLILEGARLGIDMSLVRWGFHWDEVNNRHVAVPHVYGSPVPLNDPNVVGWGTSKDAAKEASAKQLMTLGYCLS